MKPWLWTGCMTKLSPGRQQTTNWSDDNVALRKRGSLLIRCPASHAFMCERGAEQGDDLARAACRARGATGLPERGDPVLPVGQGAVKASAPSDRRDGGQPVAPGGAGLARSGHSIRCLFPGEWRMAGPQARRSGGAKGAGSIWRWRPPRPISAPSHSPPAATAPLMVRGQTLPGKGQSGPAGAARADPGERRTRHCDCGQRL